MVAGVSTGFGVAAENYDESRGGFVMLREVRIPRQVPGEPRRRCFFSHQQDLWVWFDDGGVPVAFQLCYGKYRDEHAIRWKAGQGFVRITVKTVEREMRC